MEKNMRKITVISLGLLLPILCSGCTAKIPVVTGSENIRVLNSTGITKSCQLRGRVSVAQSNIYGPSHSSVQVAQINQLKNQAAKLGANTVLILNHKTKYWPHPEYIIG